MISSFFSKTRPINFLVLLIFAALLFWVVTLNLSTSYFNSYQIGETILGSIAIVFSVFMLGNTVRIRKLTSDNSFAMLFFCILLMIFYHTLVDTNTIFAFALLMVSWSRIMALKSSKNQKEKIFESALWLFLATFFVKWTLIYIIPLYIGISIFCTKQLRLWLMPLAAFLCITILGTAIAFTFHVFDFFKEKYQFVLSWDFFLNSNYLELLYIVFISMIILFVFGKLGYRRLGRTLSLRLILAYFITSLFLMIILVHKIEQIIVLSFFPAAIFLANYLETIKNPKRKELFITSCIFLPFLGFVIRLLQ